MIVDHADQLRVAGNGFVEMQQCFRVWKGAFLNDSDALPASNDFVNQSLPLIAQCIHPLVPQLKFRLSVYSAEMFRGSVQLTDWRKAW